MTLSNQEKQKKRLIKNKQYTAFIPRFLANPFDEKLKENNIKFTDWLKENMEKYLKKN